MGLPEEFESILKEAVNSKRLSASKITNLTEIAMRNMEHDTQLVSVLYRNHKSLPTAAAKVASLYIFDALARAAKHHATKHNLSGDAFTHPGNSASFLFKMGGVVEGLFQDMLATQSPETKEKTKKILDIWIKGNTFPPTILSQLAAIFNEVEKEPDSKSMSTTDPRTANPTSQVPPPSASPITPVQPVEVPPVPATIRPNIPTMAGLDPQAALLALLTQAAASSTNIPPPMNPRIATATNIVGSSHLDATHLAVIQQLAHTAASVPPTSQSLTPAEFVNIQKFPSSSGVNGISHNLPHVRNEPRAMVRGYRSPESETRPDPRFDERDNVRGRYRSSFRNRGRGDKFQGRDWDSRDRDRYRDKDQSPARGGRGGRSRSRSPSSRYGGRKDSRYFSPPRRPQLASQYPAERDPAASGDNETGKDEFGRDIRPGSPTPPPAVNNDKSPISSTLPTLAQSSKTSLSTSNPEQSHHEQNFVSSLVTANTSNKPSASDASKSNAKDLGMDHFNYSTFDYTSPSSWEALGKMWQVTHGYLPSTEELMQFVMSTGMKNSNGAFDATNQSSEAMHPSSNNGRDNRSDVLPRGQGANVYGDNRNFHGPGSLVSNKTSQGIYTGTKYSSGGDHFVREQPVGKQENSEPSNPSNSGKMQRVGDKWVFVRGMAMDVS
ncbi:Protein NRD1 [Psilocybe cubensis]|uniref:CID domain-containing protein n=2 Tax=Psilocybe cubensis TaxID=181762 RepID=A0A8H7XUU5_PSICU|nr:Protein NRD1 [Psilocybe cubensis]KAH9479400.1 Protein NRD1 [Psilocybe cubensis]